MFLLSFVGTGEKSLKKTLMEYRDVGDPRRKPNRKMVFSCLLGKLQSSMDFELQKALGVKNHLTER